MQHGSSGLLVINGNKYNSVSAHACMFGGELRKVFSVAVKKSKSWCATCYVAERNNTQPDERECVRIILVIPKAWRVLWLLNSLRRLPESARHLVLSCADDGT